jgi:hypothetical protein
MAHGSGGSARGDPPQDPDDFRRSWGHFLSPQGRSPELTKSFNDLGTRLVEAAASLIWPLRIAVIAGLFIAVGLMAVVATAIAVDLLVLCGLIPSDHLSHVTMTVRVLPPATLFTLVGGGAVWWRGKHRKDRRQRGRHRRR